MCTERPTLLAFSGGTLWEGKWGSGATFSDGLDYDIGQMEGAKQEVISPELFGEVQLILAEKRTSLASLRTGIAVFALPLSVLGLLVATSRYYETNRVLPLLLPLLGLSAALVFLGGFLIVRSIRHIHRHDRMIQSLKQKHSAIAEYIQ
jgi:hypothetical protein